MALDATYAGLVASIIDFLARPDLTSTAPDFIKLCEAQLNRDLRVADMIKTATLTVNSASVALPADFLGIVSFELPAGTGGPLRYMKPEEVRALKQQLYTATGTPFGYSILGTNLETVPAPSGSLACTLAYYSTLPALTSSNTSNWLLTKHPDAYLYGALLQSAPYLKEDARVSVWGAIYQQIIADILRSDGRTAYGHGLTPPVRGAAAPAGTAP